MRVDPGRGSADAPVGSVEWAQRFRLGWVSAFHDLPVAPKQFLEFYKKGIETRVWTVLHGPDGKVFRTFDEFCRAPRPWGFGTPWSEIQPFLALVASKEEIALATVAPAVEPRPAPGPGRGHRNEAAPSAESFTRSKGDRSDEQLRAIARAPEAAKGLYVQGLLGQKEAAKLGPRIGKKVSPERAAELTGRAAEVAQSLASDAAKLDTSTPQLKEAAKRALSAKARDLLGIRKDRVAAALRGVEHLSENEREQFFDTCRARGWLS